LLGHDIGRVRLDHGPSGRHLVDILRAGSDLQAFAGNEIVEGLAHLGLALLFPGLELGHQVLTDIARIGVEDAGGQHLGEALDMGHGDMGAELARDDQRACHGRFASVGAKRQGENAFDGHGGPHRSSEARE
jgi:hypothetical protein